MTLSRLLSLTLLTVTLSACNQSQQSATNNDQPPAQTTNSPTMACEADINWITNPNPPDAIPGGGSDFCQFYQFSWQWFFYLMAPSEQNPSLRNFQITSDYPVLEIEGDSCSSTATEPVFFVRTVKETAENGTFTLPERIGQAGGGATIYDRNGNVVFYSISFGRSLCNAQSSGDLPADTTELKLAWRVIDDSDKANYFWIEADVIPEQGAPVGETLGLIGMHLARGTAEHRELVWASFEHRDNAPNCQNPSAAPAQGWSFTSNHCQSCLASPSQSCLNSCTFNQASPATSLTGTPSQICRVFPEGTAQGDHKADENLFDVNTLNQQIHALLNSSATPTSMQILANYFNIGALWVSDPSQPSSISNQRGSMQLANPVMETTFQGTIGLSNNQITTSTKGVVNCFACHSYQPGKTATTGLSHIFDDIKNQRGN